MPGPLLLISVPYQESEEKQVDELPCAARLCLSLRWPYETDEKQNQTPPPNLPTAGQQVFGTQPTSWFLHNTGLLPFSSEQTSFFFPGMGFPPLQLVLMNLFPCVPWLPRSRHRFTSVSPGSWHGTFT